MASQPLQLWTIGHSTQSMADFQDVLHQASIEVLVDVRRFPASRKFPHFHQDNLSRSLDQVGIRYHWLEGLGGRRSSSPTTADNNAWENKSFRNYADYMQTGEFLAACEELKRIAATGRTAIMCSESVYWRCHRRLISDYFTALGGRVEHLFPDGRTQPHSLTKIAQVHDTVPISVTYPG